MAAKKAIRKKPTTVRQQRMEVTHKYTIRKGAPFKAADAQTIAEALTQLAYDHGGKVEPKELLNAASDAEHPLHRLFEWDNDVAANKYRLIQARQIIKCVQYEVTTGTLTVDLPMFVRVVNGNELPAAKPGPGYVTLTTAIEHQSFQNHMLDRALNELKAFQARYKNMSAACTELRPVLQAIGKFERAVEKSKKSA
jgi:hypothetical protein